MYIKGAKFRKLACAGEMDGQRCLQEQQRRDSITAE